MLLAFTVFYAYIHFSQYFLIWNAAVPEETFWYVMREKGTWMYVGVTLIVGHFVIPFLALLRIEFDRVWDAESPKVNQNKLLKYQAFIDLLEHPPIIDRHRAIFGAQTQLLQYDFLRQGPKGDAAERGWHRDFVFPGDRPLSINTIRYLDDMDDDGGPTRVVSGSHRGEALPTAKDHPVDEEVALYANAGDAAFINSAIWHSGSCNIGWKRFVPR